MPKWPVREEGWEEPLAARVQQMLAETAERHSLEVDWSDSDIAYRSCTWPHQTGLDFELWFAFSYDEITFGGDGWFADVFPADDPDKWRRISASIDGLVTGEARVLLYFALGREKPYWTVLQLQNGTRWENISTGVGCALPPIVRPVILRNGHPLQRRLFRPAWGSLLILLAVALLLFGILH